MPRRGRAAVVEGYDLDALAGRYAEMLERQLPRARAEVTPAGEPPPEPSSSAH